MIIHTIFNAKCQKHVTFECIIADWDISLIKYKLRFANDPFSHRDRLRLNHAKLAEMGSQGLRFPCLLCVGFVFMHTATSAVTKLVQRRYLTSVQPSDVWPKYIYETVVFNRKPTVGSQAWLQNIISIVYSF